MNRSAAALALLVASCDCGGSRLTTASGRLEVAPEQLDFGAVPIGEAESAAIELTNRGDYPLVIRDLTLEQPAFTVDSFPERLTAGESIAIRISFAPPAAGTWSDALSIETDAGSAKIDLEGEGIGMDTPRLCVSPPSIHFADTSVPMQRDITVSACSGLPITISALDFTVPSNDIATVASDPPFSISGDRTITIAYTPSDQLPDRAVLTVRSSDAFPAAIDIEITGNPEIVPEEAGRFLYFWQVASPMQSNIVRIPLQGGGAAAPFFGQSTGAVRCPGCHQISPDGRYVAIVELDLLLRPTAFILEVDSMARTDLPPELASASSISWKPNETDRFAAGVAGDILLGSLSRGYLGPLIQTTDDDAMPSWGSKGEIAFVRGTFTRLFEGVAFEGPTDLMIAGEEDGTAIALPGASANGAASYYPTFSRNGSWIAFTESAAAVSSYAALDAQVRLVAADRSGTVRDLSAINSSATSFPTWSVDGSHLSVSSNRPGGAGGWDIYLVPIDQETGEVVGPIANLTSANSAGFEHGVQWSP